MTPRRTARNKPTGPRTAGAAEPQSVRIRILDAAFAAFTEHGYSDTSTLEIATRAKVSKRELYALVGTKHDMLVACITARASRMRSATEIPAPRDREMLAGALTAVGTRMLSEASHPTVIAVYRLAIAEAHRAPEVARALESIGREANRADLRELLGAARSAGLLHGEAAEMVEQFIALLWGNLLIGLLLRVADPPTSAELARRTQRATRAFLRLYPQPGSAEA
jgi:AcrR family transcriptional regulator